jgi:low affinity Fe/Cu permease
MKFSFSKFSRTVEKAVGTPAAFFIAILSVVIWAITGPLFNFSSEWQLVINTGTTIVTFLMVFALQATQSRDNTSTQLKLDELIRINKEARNFLIGSEDMDNKKLEAIKDEFKKLPN